MAPSHPTSVPPGTFARLRNWGQRFAATVLPARGGGDAGRPGVGASGDLQTLLRESRMEHGGEISARDRAERIAAIYRGAETARREVILDAISREFTPDREALEGAIAAMTAAASEDERGHAEARMRLALGAPRAKFFAQFNLLPEGVKFLVDLRADLLGFLAHGHALDVLRVELDGLLESWFDPGFLELRRITWQSPALVLEKLIVNEAVHPIESWDDLRNRLDLDRRCYAFFHPRMPSEPLIFVEIALLKGLPGKVQALLDQRAPVQDVRAADTAVFYSISNAQKGLRGISFGNLLLKRVIEDLRRDLPWLKTYATLSPLPGFRKWLDRALAERRGLSAADDSKLAAVLGHPDPGAVLADALAREEWPAGGRIADAIREPMEKLCARYLLQEKLGRNPLDPVAHFHLNNGARVNRLFWLADSSPRGLRQSYGMMASYRYDLSEVERNHEEFLQSGRIAAARRVKRLID
ncbi:MAG: malonyl-CoA decarboxylase family protein [Burkholderiales bacterium]